jgi:hypothetical protein
MLLDVQSACKNVSSVLKIDSQGMQVSDLRNHLPLFGPQFKICGICSGHGGDIRLSSRWT